MSLGASLALGPIGRLNFISFINKLFFLSLLENIEEFPEGLIINPFCGFWNAPRYFICQNFNLILAINALEMKT